jgi:uncharacterized membrane-anchored protein YhcB (DUF1043 family)
MGTSILMVITFIIGVGVGFAVYHAFFRLSPQEKQLDQQLQEARHEFKEYQLRVSNSLNRTAELINNMATGFDQLHDHILQDSVSLNLDSHKQSILQPDPHAHHVIDEDEQVTEFHPAQVKPMREKAPRPPRDYA